MDFKSKFYTIFKSLNPYNYKDLSEHKISYALKYFFFIVLFSSIVMLLLFIPTIYNTKDTLNSGISHFDNFTISSQFSAKESFNILSDPLIRFESTEKNITSEFVLVTPQTISYKKYLLFGSRQDFPIVHEINLVSGENAREILSFWIFFILPSIFFWAFIPNRFFTGSSRDSRGTTPVAFTSDPSIVVFVIGTPSSSFAIFEASTKAIL